MNRKVFLYGLLGLVLIAGLIAVGVGVYNAGVAQGAAFNSDQAPMLIARGPIRILLPVGIGILLLVFLMRFAMPIFFMPAAGFRRWRWRMHHRDWCWDGGVPPVFEELHRRAHEALSETDEGESAEK